MAGSRLRILARNLADTATLAASPIMLPTLPITSLQQQTLRGVTARSSGLASQDVLATWSSDQKANMLAFTRTNLSTAATLRSLIFIGGSPTTAVYDSSALGAFSTSGLDTDIDIYTEADFRMLRNTVQYFPLVTNMQQALARIADAANADGYIEMTRMWIGKYFEFTYDPPFEGAGLQVEDLSKGSRADDGSHIVDKKGKFRRLTLRLDFIPDADLPTVLGIARYLGKDKECFLSLYPGWGGAKELYNMMACRLIDSPTFNPWQVGLHKNTMTFEET